MKNRANFNEIVFLLSLAETNNNFNAEKSIESLANIQLSTYKQVATFYIQNGIAPYLFNNYQKNNLLQYFPSEFCEILKVEHKKQIFRNLNIRTAFLEVTNKLRFEHIDFVLLKGIELQHRLYYEPALRPMIDIDMLLAPENVNLATELLIEMGAKQVYVSENPFIDSLKHHASPLIFNEVAIEIHRELLDNYDLATIKNEDIWAETEIINIDGVASRVMKPELLLLYLCHHLHNTISGGKIKLIAFLDIYLLLNKFSDKIDSEKLVKLMQSTNTKISVYQTIAQVKRIFPEVDIPKAIVNEVHNIEVNEKLLIKALMGRGILFSKSHYIMKFNRIEGFTNKMLYLHGKLFPSKHFLKHKYKTNNRLKLIALAFIHSMYFLVQAFLSFFSYLRKILTFK